MKITHLYTKTTALGLALSLRAPEYMTPKPKTRVGKGHRKANKASRWA